MNVHQESVNQRLKEKIELLLSAYDKLQVENLKLSEKNRELESNYKQKCESFDELEKHFSQVQLTKAFVATSNNVHEAKDKVKRIVREIDQCIALLNK